MADAPSQAVFLSYASQDAAALRASGVEVWFDQNELVGGDAWDAKIRGQIASCALFVPVISAATQARLEGYFRVEWKLAARRTHAMATAKAFLLPIVIDGTRDAEAHVPDEFREVQWTRLPGGETPAAFCGRVGNLLGQEGVAVGPVGDRAPAHRSGLQVERRPTRPWLLPAIVGGRCGRWARAVATMARERRPDDDGARCLLRRAEAGGEKGNENLGRACADGER